MLMIMEINSIVKNVIFVIIKEREKFLLWILHKELYMLCDDIFKDYNDQF